LLRSEAKTLCPRRFGTGGKKRSRIKKNRCSPLPVALVVIYCLLFVGPCWAKGFPTHWTVFSVNRSCGGVVLVGTPPFQSDCRV